MSKRKEDITPMVTIPTEILEEERDGQKVVILSSKMYEELKPKKASRKKKFFLDNNIDLKYLDNIYSSKGNYSFKMTNIPDMEELKKLIQLNEKYEKIKLEKMEN
jgi:hypothetical protein